MQFAQSAGAAGLDLYTDFRKLCGIGTSDTTTVPINPDFTLGANNALDQIVSFIILHDKRWQWDDSNNTDLPSATAPLVSGQSNYSLATTHLKLLDVKIKDENGNLKDVDRIEDNELAEYQVKYPSSGAPLYWTIRGNSLFLLPAPNYAHATGLKMFFQRGASLFAVSDTTKTPGFPSSFHRLVSLYTALDYVADNNMPGRYAHIQGLIEKLERKFAEYLQGRAGDSPAHLDFEEDEYGQDYDINGSKPYQF